MSIDPFGDSLARYAIIDARGGRAVIQMLDSAPVLRSEQVLCIKLPLQQRHHALAGAADQSEFGNIVRMVKKPLSLDPRTRAVPSEVVAPERTAHERIC